MKNYVWHADCLDVLKNLPAASVHLIIVDPPYQTGNVQRDAHSQICYLDFRNDYIEWLTACMIECKRILMANGSIYIWLGEKISYKIRYLIMDQIFGENNWLNTLIWSFDFGGRSKRMWPRKHDTVLLYVNDPTSYVFNHDAVERLPYMAPSLAGPHKASVGKFPTDVLWCTVVPTSGHERLHYPNQKPVKVLEQLILASSNKGDVVLDFCAGSGTTGAAAHALGRRFILIDNNVEAIAIMKRRFENVNNIEWVQLP
jgi:site-specific DNA-methyltransferase (adenine-specific)